MLMDRLKRLFSRQEIPVEARDILAGAKTPQEMLRGLDELITRNEVEVDRIHQEIEALERVEGQEKERVRTGGLADRSRNNALRRIQRLRKQMDNLEERLRIYNRNINLQIHLAGKVQALDAMELRGVDEEKIDSILLEYEEELSQYSSVLDTEEVASRSLPAELDDSAELRVLEEEILGSKASEGGEPTPSSGEGAADAGTVSPSSSHEDGVLPTKRSREEEGSRPPVPPRTEEADQ